MIFVVLAPALIALVFLITAGIYAPNAKALTVSGIVALFFLIVQDLIFRVLIRLNEAWGGDGGPKPELTWMEIGAITAVVVYFVLGFIRLDKKCDRTGPQSTEQVDAP